MKHKTRKEWRKRVVCSKCGYETDIDQFDLYLESRNGSRELYPCFDCVNCEKLIFVNVPEDVKIFLEGII